MKGERRRPQVVDPSGGGEGSTAARWRRSRRPLAIAALSLLFVGLRWMPMTRQGLWTDEYFSLAVATGHSLEHPAAAARPQLGDYAESPGPVPARELARYLEHERPAAGLGRVVRATRLSDTSPPLYYALLWGWTRLFGTGDSALRSLSLLGALLALPLLADLARRLGGRRAVAPALLLYTLAPISIRYSTEGRMYALVWTIALAQAATSLRLRRRRHAPVSTWALWTGLSVVGLLLHYFYFFVLAALAIWLLAVPARVPRSRLALALALTALAVTPWYSLIVETSAQWRVTQGWLDGFPGVRASLEALFYTGWELVTLRVPWRLPLWTNRPLLALFAVALVTTLGAPRRRAAWLPAIWLTAALGGLLAFDLVFRTHTAAVARYALAGLPALLLLVAMALAGWPAALRFAYLCLVAGLWLPAHRILLTSSVRDGLPYVDAARQLEQRLTADDLIIVQSIPSGVAGLARARPGPAPVLSWVEPLGVRSAPRDLERWTTGRGQVALVSIHRPGGVQPARDWLEREAVATWRWWPARSDAEIVVYQLGGPAPGATRR